MNLDTRRSAGDELLVYSRNHLQKCGDMVLINGRKHVVTAAALHRFVVRPKPMTAHWLWHIYIALLVLSLLIGFWVLVR